MELALPPEWVTDLPDDRLLTADDFLRLPEGPPYFELIEGEMVEVLSPSTRRPDITVKRDLYERGGVAAYWIVDVKGPRLNALELDPATGAYVEVADLDANGVFEAEVPYRVAIDVGRMAD